ncbi:MAG TPA: L,D-transpeptidase [Lacunisphaera sp.]|nr:L,D-transpeptidase [Lacunisphaera sp.]
MKFLIFNPLRSAIVVAMSLTGPLRFIAMLLPLVAANGVAQDAPPPPAPAASSAAPAEAATSPATPAAAAAAPAPDAVRPVETWLEAQVELARRGFSSGSIDGVRGPQSAAALRAFQRAAGLDDTGALDQPTRESLLLTAPALSEHAISAEEKASVRPLPATWLGKSEQPTLTYATVLELVAERFHASPRFLQRLNPDVNWDDLLPGVVVKVPNIERASVTSHAAKLHVRLGDHELEATDDNGTVIAHFPVSIARNVDKRPVGELHVVVVIPDPNYTFDPEVFPESPEGRELGRKLVIPPGPNNPVGVAWIGLDRTGYGIHGTPDPEKVGRTESHGCFRLANWDARTLLDLAWVGMPVIVEP